jgi:hypothetical protein
MRRLVAVIAGTFTFVFALLALCFSVIRGPHISDSTFIIATASLAALITSLFFAFLLYFWDHPAFKRP